MGCCRVCAIGILAYCHISTLPLSVGLASADDDDACHLVESVGDACAVLLSQLIGGEIGGEEGGEVGTVAVLDEVGQWGGDIAVGHDFSGFGSEVVDSEAAYVSPLAHVGFGGMDDVFGGDDDHAVEVGSDAVVGEEGEVLQRVGKHLHGAEHGGLACARCAAEHEAWRVATLVGCHVESYFVDYLHEAFICLGSVACGADGVTVGGCEETAGIGEGHFPPKGEWSIGSTIELLQQCPYELRLAWCVVVVGWIHVG